jgi:hypothetical protein
MELRRFAAEISQTVEDAREIFGTAWRAALLVPRPIVRVIARQRQRNAR